MKNRIRIWFLAMGLLTLLALTPAGQLLADGNPMPICGPNTDRRCALPPAPAFDGNPIPVCPTCRK